jgi:hypothetical protein
MNELDIVADTAEAKISKSPVSLADQSRQKLGELLDLNDEQKSRIKTFLKEQIKNWLTDTADLHRRLQDDNDLVEGIIMETDFPWVDCCNIHSPITEIYMDGYGSIIKRSVLGAGNIWVAEAEVDELMDMTADIEEMMNFKARNEWNIEHGIRNVIWPTDRDGLGVIQCPYVEEYERSDDIVLLTNEQDFLNEFPSPEDAGISEEEWFNLAELSKQASDEFPVEVPITADKQTYAGPKAEIVEAVDFVTFPAWVADIKTKSCRGYGKRFTAHIEEIREKAENKVFYKDVAKSVINGNAVAKASSYIQAKDEIVGIKRTTNKDERDLYELVIKGRLDEGGEIKKLLVTYSYEDDQLLGCMDYIYRVDFYALFRIDERPNQLFGKNIPAKTRDLNDLSDTLINQEVNTRTISTVPIFMGQKDMKEELDPELQQNKIKPGMIIWLSNFDSFTQFKIQPTDLGENANLQERLMRILDMYLGMPASLFAGGVPSGDPSAPGNKTASLINQGNLRMEDPISTFRYGVEELGNICLSHMYQFGPPIIQFKTTNDDGTQIKTIHKKFLRKNIKLKMNGITVLDNPDAEMQKQFQLYTVLMTNPEFAQNPQAQNEVLKDALVKGRVNGRDRYLPSPEEIQQQQVDTQKKAMLQIAAQKQAQDQQAQEEQVKTNLAKIKQAMTIKKTAQDLAENNLDLAPTNGAAPV